MIPYVHCGRFFPAWAARVIAAVLVIAITASSSTLSLASETSSDGTSAEQASYELQQESTPVTDAVPSEIQQRVEETASAYNDAVALRQSIEDEISQNQARIDEIESSLPELRDQASDAIVSEYKNSQGIGLFLSIVFSSTDFSSLISNIEYCNEMHRYNADNINELLSAEQELEDLQNTLQTQLDEAKAAEDQAAAALEEAQQARAEAIAEAQRQAEEAAAQAAAEAAAAQAQANATSETTTTEQTTTTESQTSGQTETVQTDSSTQTTSETATDTSSTGTDTSTTDSTSLTSDRDSFIATWGPRIDAYLSGSPMAGMGYTFAAAAWDYGIDPRISPAIAYVESSLGAYCFLPYNAWGWGSSSWSSWEEAIYAHVAGMSRGYGSTLDYDDALSYCPTDPYGWYTSVTSQMERI
jgi:peptidoglycan hydrolase CwlO-like protein